MSIGHSPGEISNRNLAECDCALKCLLLLGSMHGSYRAAELAMRFLHRLHDDIRLGGGDAKP